MSETTMNPRVRDGENGNGHWVEAPLGAAAARAEAWRCLQCFDAPCTRACPAGIPIPRFIRMLRGGNPRGAAEVVRAANPLAGSCGRACPGEMLCGAACTRNEVDQPVEIRRLHAFATDWEGTRRPRVPRAGDSTGAPATGEVKARTKAKRPGADSPATRGRSRQHRVAVVGGGPAGIACASELRRLGVGVVLYEARNRVGGVLSETIPLYRFPAGTAESDAELALGGRRGKGEVEVRLRSRVVDVKVLATKFDAVFVAPGLGAEGPAPAGGDLRGVERAEAFLARCRARAYRIKVGPVAVVIGGGNTAIDAALAVLRCGREADPAASPRVHLLYRRTRAEMPAWEREVREAEALGVVLHALVQPLEFTGKRGRLEGVRLTRMALGPPGRDGRPAPVPVPGSEYLFACDLAVLATGRRVEPGLGPALPRTRDGLLRVHAGGGHARDNVYAGGDATGGEQTIVAAVRDGKAAARAIAAQLGIGGAGEVSHG